MTRRRPDSAPDEGLFHASVSLGRVAGVEIGVNWSWLLIVGVMVASLATTVFPEQNPGLSDATYVSMAVSAVVLFFASRSHTSSATRSRPDTRGWRSRA